MRMKTIRMEEQRTENPTLPPVTKRSLNVLRPKAFRMRVFNINSPRYTVVCARRTIVWVESRTR